MQISELVLRLGEFNGPMDVLVEKIRTKKMDIMEVDLVDLTNQYLQHVQTNLKNLSVEQISDYLVMASYLIELKSKHILAALSGNDTLGDEEAEEENLFIRYLLEYKQYKKVLPFVEKLGKHRNMVFAKPEDDASLFEDNEIPLVLPDKLSKRQIMTVVQRLREHSLASTDVVQKILVEELPVEDVEKRLYEVIQSFDNPDQFYTFKHLLKRAIADKLTPMFFVTAFIAILNLGHHQKIKVDQNAFDDEVLVKQHHEDEQAASIPTEQELLEQRAQFEKDVQEYVEKLKKERSQKYWQKRNEFSKKNNSATSTKPLPAKE